MTTDGSLDVQQAKCPLELVEPGVNSPPPTDRSGWQVRNSLMVGDRGWITQYGIYRDEHFGLWCEGTASVHQESDEYWCVHIERTDQGVRVLEWPAVDSYGYPNFIKLKKANHYGAGDCWVVEFPT